MLNFEKRYRPNAAVVVTDGAGRVLLCYRKDKPRGVVQTVQGGIDPGETPEEAAEREVEEEIGLKRGTFDIVAVSKQKFRYNWSLWTRMKSKEGWTGQEQQFFLAKVHPDAVFVLDSHHSLEFEKVEWGTPEEMVEKAWDLKRKGIENALREFGLLESDPS